MTQIGSPNGTNARLLWWIMGVLLTILAGGATATFRNEDVHGVIQTDVAAAVRVVDNHEQRLKWLEERNTENQKVIVANQERILRALDDLDKRRK